MSVTEGFFRHPGPPVSGSRQMTIGEAKQQKRRFKRRFNYFAVGETPPGSGVTILEPREQTSDQSTTAYLVRYLCCGADAQMAHKSITARVRRGCRKCAPCAVSARKRAEQALNGKRTLTKAVTEEDLTADYGVTPPEWPVPRRALIGAHVPFYDRAGER